MKTKTKIIRGFLEQHKDMTISDISKSINADYKITHTATQILLKDQVLLSKKVGSATLCQLNPKYYGIEILHAEEERKKSLLQDKNLRQLHRDIISKLDTTLFVLLFTRSRAPGIHLTFISNEPNFKKKVELALSTIPLQIQPTVLTETQFRQEKDQHQNKIILHNLESYYLLKK
jgi:hypothetical protein